MFELKRKWEVFIFWDFLTNLFEDPSKTTHKFTAKSMRDAVFEKINSEYKDKLEDQFDPKIVKLILQLE